MAKRTLSLKRRSHQLVENEEENKYPENSKMAKQSVVDRFNTTSDEEMAQICSTEATCLFNAGVPEQIIQKTTGHRLLPALHTYERVSCKQHQAVSRVMMSGGNDENSFDKELKHVSGNIVTKANGSEQNL